MNALTADFFRMSGGCVGFAEGRRLRCDRPTGARMKDFSLEDAMNGFSKLRNNALGDALEYMKEVEAWGGGVSRYFTACAASGLPPPAVTEEAGFFKVVFWRRDKGDNTLNDTTSVGNVGNSVGNVGNPIGLIYLWKRKLSLNLRLSA